MKFIKSHKVSLKSHPEFNEAWLQNLIAEDTTILGLGSLDVLTLEKKQPNGGRLDMLLVDPETLTRYEVEIQLGATDPSHIIRAIEYWDVERTRYPQHEHVAVLVAEDITSRFLNILGLFNKAIPLIAIQLNALQVEGSLTVSTATVLDLSRMSSDDEEPGEPVDSAYWVKKTSAETVATVEEMADLIEAVDPGLAVKWNRRHVGLSRAGMAQNTVLFTPRKGHTIAAFRIDRSDEVSALVDDSGLDSMGYNARTGRYRVRLSRSDVAAHRDTLIELVRRSLSSSNADDFSEG